MRIIIFAVATIHIVARAVLIEINGKAGRTCWIEFTLETPEGKSILKLAETDHPGCPNYRRASEVISSRGFEETSEDRLDFVGAVGFRGGDTA